MPSYIFKSPTAVMSPGFYASDDYAICDETKGEEKFCFGMRSSTTINNCIETRDCKVLVAVSIKNGIISFEMRSPTPSGTWFAVGLSKDGQMGDDLVFVCKVNENNQIELKTLWNLKHKSNLVTTDPTVKLTKSSFKNNVASCGWNSPGKITVNNDNKNFIDLLNEEFNMLLASGPVIDGKIEQHFPFTRVASSFKVKFAKLTDPVGRDILQNKAPYRVWQSKSRNILGKRIKQKDESYLFVILSLLGMFLVALIVVGVMFATRNSDGEDTIEEITEERRITKSPANDQET